MLLHSPSFTEDACTLVEAQGCAQALTHTQTASWGCVLQPAQVQAPAVLVEHSPPTLAASVLKEQERDQRHPRPCLVCSPA